MKKYFILFLFLLPCLAWAQYPSNGNQKITLGEQSTADGLIWRGVAATDTVRKPSVDTMAYMVLDTTTNIIWHYKKATSNAWLRLNLLPSDTASMLNPYWRAGRFSGTLPVANGGTNITTMPTGYILHGDGTSVDTSLNLFWDRTYNRLGIGTNAPLSPFSVNATNAKSATGFWHVTLFDNTAFNTGVGGGFTFGGLKSTTANEVFAAIDSYKENATSGNAAGAMRFHTQGAGGQGLVEWMRISSSGRVDIYNLAGTGSRTVIADNGGSLTAPVSTINSKENVNTINYGLNDLLQLKPVSFNFIDKNKWGEGLELGFIVEDMFSVIPEVTGIMNDETLFLDMTKLIPVLTKAIQEQNLLIKALEQRIINLENK